VVVTVDWYSLLYSAFTLRCLVVVCCCCCLLFVPIVVVVTVVTTFTLPLLLLLILGVYVLLPFVCLLRFYPFVASLPVAFVVVRYRCSCRVAILLFVTVCCCCVCCALRCRFTVYL